MLINLVIQPEQGWLKTAARFCARRHLERVTVRCCNPQVDVCQAPRVCGTGVAWSKRAVLDVAHHHRTPTPSKTNEMASETSGLPSPRTSQGGISFFLMVWGARAWRVQAGILGPEAIRSEGYTNSGRRNCCYTRVPYELIACQQTAPRS